jgi:hypothetical protein
MSYELAIINPRKRKTRKRASAKQIAARRRFVAKFAKGRKARKARAALRRKPRRIKSGVPAMAKRRRRRSAKRSTKGRFVKKARKSVAKVRRRRVAGKRRPAVGYTIGSRRIRRRKLNPVGRRRRYRRNPISVGGLLGQLVPAAYGAGGALALNLGLSYLPLPDSLKTGWARHGVRLAGAFALGYGAKKFLGSKGQMVAAGALTVVMYDLLKEVINMAAPAIGTRLGEFEDVSLADDGFIDTASPIRGFGAYLQGDPDDSDGAQDGVGAYLEGNLDGNLDAYNYV